MVCGLTDPRFGTLTANIRKRRGEKVDIRLPLDHVDVNVHPTKKEVLLMHEQDVLDQVQSALRAKLSSGDVSRTFMAATSGGPVFAFADGTLPPAVTSEPKQVVLS